jgi:hypothetical protein
MKTLKALYLALQSFGLTKYAQEVKDLDEEYDEPWHEEAVKELEEEEEELLRKTVPYYAPPTHQTRERDYNIMLENGIQPVESGGSTFINKGLEGSVYNVIYNNKPAVAKVSKNKMESEIWKDILSAKDKMSAEHRKYFPEIYDLKSDPDTGMSIIIMEKLIPLPKEVERAWEAGRKISDKLIYFPNLYVDHNLKDKLEKRLLIMREMRGGYIDIDLVVPSKSQLESELADHKISGYTSFGNIHGEQDKIYKILADYIFGHNRKLRLDGSEIMKLTYRIEDYVKDLCEKEEASLKTSRMAVSHKSRTDNLSPEFEGILAALQELSEHGIHWEDLHEKNVMISPVTKDLKIIDVGYFSY